MAEARKTTMGHITTDHIEQSAIALPPIEVIQAFSKIIAPIHEKIGHCKKENHELTKLRDWLLPMLMNGQATVADEAKITDKILTTPIQPKQQYEVRQAARTYGADKKDDTADLLRELLRRKKNDT